MAHRVSAWYVGDGTPRKFKPGLIYPLTMKTYWFSQKVLVWQRSTFDGGTVPGTLHQFDSHKKFKACWQIIKKEK